MRNFLLLILSIIILSSPAASQDLPKNFPKCFESDVDSSNYCPYEGKIGHKFVLVDFTSRWHKAQVDWIQGRIFGNVIVNSTPPFYRISYLKIDDKEPLSQEIIYSKCRFKSGKKTKFKGDEVNKKCEGIGPIKDIFATWNSQLNEVEKSFFDSHTKEAENSFVIEYIVSILNEPKFDFLNDYPERELVIVSDLMQYSKRIDFYHFCRTPLDLNQQPNKCKSFEKLLKNKKIKRYFETRKPENLDNLKVTIFFMNHSYQTKCNLEESLESLWSKIFEYWGINNVKWNYETDNSQSCPS